MQDNDRPSAEIGTGHFFDDVVVKFAEVPEGDTIQQFLDQTVWVSIHTAHGSDLSLAITQTQDGIGLALFNEGEEETPSTLGEIEVFL